MQLFDLDCKCIYGGIKWNVETNKRLSNPLYLEQYGYKVYSQNDEDGIIEEIFKRIGVTNREFVEFGVEDGTENNTRFLLLQGWKGLWIEGSKEFSDEIERDFRNEIKSGKLIIENAFITKDNINSLIGNAVESKEIDLLSIDIDGNDYHIWKGIDVINPRVVIIEYNAKFPPSFHWVMGYQEDYVWDGTDCFGASLKALEELGEEKGYSLVGTNICGTNAFFVRKELLEGKFASTGVEDLYNPARYDIFHYSGHPARRGLNLRKAFIKKVGDPQELFITLEKSIKENDLIEISNAERRNDIQQCIEAFVKKYSVMIEDVSGMGNEKVVIYLKKREKDKTGHYLDIQGEYDSEYYLNDCGGYKEFKETDGRSLDARLLNMMYLIEPNKDDVILDIGCGRGELTYALSKTANKVIGIDYSEDAIRLAKKNFKNVKEMKEGKLKFICGDVVNLQSEGKFSKIVMADVYEHIEEEVMEGLLKKIAGMLSDDGVLYIHTMPNLDWYKTVYAKEVILAKERGEFLPKNPRSRYEDRMHINEQTTESLKETLLRFFSQVYAWTGSIRNIEQLDDIKKQDISNEITAVAGREINLEKLFNKMCYLKIDRANVNVDLECAKDCVKVNENEVFEIPVLIKNKGIDVLKSKPPYPVHLSYHIYNDRGEIVVFDGERSLLSGEILPKTDRIETVVVSTKKLAPGEYDLKVDLVQEGNFWFSDVLEDAGATIRLKIDRLFCE